MSDESDYGNFPTKSQPVKQTFSQPLINLTKQIPGYATQKNVTLKQNSYLDQKNIKSTFKQMFISGLPTDSLKLACNQLKINDYQPGNFQFSGEEYFKFSVKNDEQAKQILSQGQQQTYSINGKRIPLTIGYLDTNALNNPNCYVVIKYTNGQSTNVRNLYTTFQEQNPVTIRKIDDWYLVCFSQEETALHTFTQQSDDLPCIFERFNEKYQQPFKEYVQLIKNKNLENQQQQKPQNQQILITSQPKIQNNQLTTSPQKQISFQSEINLQIPKVAEQNNKFSLQSKQTQNQTKTQNQSINQQYVNIDVDVESITVEPSRFNKPKQRLQPSQDSYQQKGISQLNIQIQQAIQRQQNELIKLNKQQIKTNIVQFVNKSFDNWLQLIIDGAENDIQKKINDAEKSQFNQFQEQKAKFEKDLITLQEKVKNIILTEINGVIVKEDNILPTNVGSNNPETTSAKQLFKKQRLQLEKGLTEDIEAIAKSIEQIK